ncbi:MAG TPA: NusA N-terminal domain-containing protein, partial [Gaiellaceae bacterium]|nr:NusA N-terminal domain-containing protein [Gaiellaceae bacterium]
MSQEIVEAVREIEREKGIESGTLVSALEDALLAAYKKTPGASRHATVELDDRGDFRVYSIDIPPDIEERLLDEARERALDELERIEEETGEKNHTLLADEDLDLDLSRVPEHLVTREDVTPDNFGRIAAQTAKQVIVQRIREAERDTVYNTYSAKLHDIVLGTVQRYEQRNMYVLLDDRKTEALLPFSEQVSRENYRINDRIRAYVLDVRKTNKGPLVVLSRAAEGLVQRLIEFQVPEIQDDIVEIMAIAREPGARTKVAVTSKRPEIDAVGA